MRNLKLKKKTLMTLIRNISLGIALCGASMLTAAPDLPIRNVNGTDYYYYEVPSKMTIYSLTRQLGYSRDEIIKHNPQVRDGLRAGDVLFFPVESTEPEVVEEVVVVEEPVEEVVVEVFEEEEVVTEVPEEEVVVEVSEEEEVVTEEEVAPVEYVIQQQAVDSVNEEATEPASEALNVAVALPFMLNSESHARQAENQLDFYQGMLLAINDFAPKSEVKINLHVHDTNGSLNVLDSLAAAPGFNTLDYIIAPADNEAIEHLAAKADSTGAMLINVFAVKSEAHNRHESVVQGNVSRDRMYDIAIKAFCESFGDSKAIILSSTDVTADKKEFVDKLQEAMVQAGIPYEEVEYTGRLAPELLSTLPVRNYVFVPTGSSREVLLNILPTLTAYRAAYPEQDIRLFGYPEWITLRGEIKDNLHKMNTMIYSRLTTDVTGAEAKRISGEYKKWFGKDLPQAVPNMVFLGYDTMAWIIFAAANDITEPYTGVQNAFKIQETPDGGLENESLYLISFGANGKMETKNL